MASSSKKKDVHHMVDNIFSKVGESAPSYDDEEIARILALEARGVRNVRVAPSTTTMMMRPSINKNFLVNTITSVSVHNKREEEADCWRIYDQQKMAESLRRKRRESESHLDRKRVKVKDYPEKGLKDGSLNEFTLQQKTAESIAAQKKGMNLEWRRNAFKEEEQDLAFTALSAKEQDGSSCSSSSSSSVGKDSSKISHKDKKKKKKKKGKEKEKKKKKHDRKKKHRKTK